MVITLNKTDRQYFDEALRTIKAGGTLALEDADYTTRGPWFGGPRDLSFTEEGVTIEAGNAQIILENPLDKASTGPRIDWDFPILHCPPNTTIRGGIWNANQAKQLPTMRVSGIRFYGKFTISKARIIGLRGSKSNATPHMVEVFAISSEGKTGGSLVENVTVDSCAARDSKFDYVSGIFMGSTEDSPEASVIRNCKVDLGTVGQFAYSANGNSPVTIENCTGDAARFFYNDTGPTKLARIINCTGNASYAAISLALADGFPVTERNVIVRNSRFLSPAGRGLEWNDATRGNMKGAVTFVDCVLNADYLSAIIGWPQVAFIDTQLSHVAKITTDPASARPFVS